MKRSRERKEELRAIKKGTKAYNELSRGDKIASNALKRFRDGNKFVKADLQKAIEKWDEANNLPESERTKAGVDLNRQIPDFQKFKEEIKLPFTREYKEINEWETEAEETYLVQGELLDAAQVTARIKDILGQGETGLIWVDLEKNFSNNECVINAILVYFNGQMYNVNLETEEAEVISK